MAAVCLTACSDNGLVNELEKDNRRYTTNSGMYRATQDYEEPLERYFKGLENDDGQLFLQAFDIRSSSPLYNKPSAIINYYNTYHSHLQNKYGYGFSIDYTITDFYDMTEDVKNGRVVRSKNYTEIEEAYELELSINITGDNKDRNIKTSSVYVGKYQDKWVLFNFIFNDTSEL